MGTWGIELWDRYSCVLSHVNKGGDELSTVLAKFVREKGEVEKEYAKNIRKLVAKYTNKIENKNGKETSQSKGFRLVLQEIGFQAGQHEILAETFSQKLHLELQRKSKEISKMTKKNLKDAKNLSDDLDNIYKDLEKTKNKYKKSFIDWEDAKENYIKAEKDGILSRKEIAKLRSLSNSREAQFDDYKSVYASQLMKTNKYQDQYYNKHLPTVLDGLQNIEMDRIECFKDALNQCLDAERKVAPILDKCREDMGSLVQSIDPTEDTHLLIKSLKTGDKPPKEIQFEEITCRAEAKFGTLGKRKSNLKLKKTAGDEKLFPQKRELESQIDNVEIEIDKGNKEIAAIQLMVQSYTDNPKFGDPKKFQAELDAAIHHVQVLESELHSLNIKLDDINNQLDGKIGESPKHTIPNTLTLPVVENNSVGSGSNSIQSGSAGYGSISNCSNSERDCESLDNSEAIGEEQREYVNSDHDLVIALYSYDGDCGETSIAMEAGEEFIVTEEDEGGWTRVRRKSSLGVEGEGYVPTAYLEFIH